MKIKLYFIFPLIAVFVLGACTAVEPIINGPGAFPEVPAEWDLEMPIVNDSQPELESTGDFNSITVSPELSDCPEGDPQQCIQVKWDQDADWDMISDQFAGYTFEPGYQYQVTVQKRGSGISSSGSAPAGWRVVGITRSGRVGGGTGTTTTGSSQGGQIVWGNGTTTTGSSDGGQVIWGNGSTTTGSSEGGQNVWGNGTTTITNVNGGQVVGSTVPAGINSILWVLVGMPVDYDQPLMDMPQIVMVLDFGSMQVSGNSGCNTYAGSFTFDESQVSIGTLETTYMACDQRIMDHEIYFLQLLQQTTGYQFYENQLTLITADGQTLVFAPMAIE